MLRPRVRMICKPSSSFLDFFRRVAVDHGPVIGCDADHLVISQVFIEDVQRCRRAGTAGRSDGGADFMGQGSAGFASQFIHEGDDFTRRRSPVDRRADDQPSAAFIFSATASTVASSGTAWTISASIPFSLSVSATTDKAVYVQPFSRGCHLTR